MNAADTIRENFLTWHSTLATTHELALCQARALAPLLAAEHHAGEGGIGALRHKVLHILGPTDRNNFPISLQGAAERLAFCEAFLAAHPTLINELMLSPVDGESAIDAEAYPLRIAAMRAAISTHAKALLPPMLAAAESIYCNSFQELCEMLAHGQVNYALLPVENTSEGILRRSYDLIERFELHIACTVEIPTPDGGFTRIALLYHSRSPALSATGCTQFLECRTTATDSGALTELLTVAQACAMTLRRIDTHATEDSELYQHIIFEVSGTELLFATYLALFIPRTVITEKYLHLIRKDVP